MPEGAPAATWRLVTPAAPGAVGVIQIEGDVERAMRSIGLARVPPGRIVLRNLLDVDRGLVAHWACDGRGCVHLMPHGGAAVVRAIGERLDAAGLRRADRPDPVAAFPEASSVLEARMLAAMAAAASPLAIDLLLAQPARWDAWMRAGKSEDDPSLDARSRVLRRLIEPPLVVALGAPNIGKSSLLNALARRSVARVADEPGTTRDYVGAMLDVGGLVVRYADAPGIRGTLDPIERRSIDLALDLAARSDLVLMCSDAGGPATGVPGVSGGAAVLRVATRADRSPAHGGADVATSAKTGEGLEELSAAIRERLVPNAAIDDPAPWRFW